MGWEILEWLCPCVKSDRSPKGYIAFGQFSMCHLGSPHFCSMLIYNVEFMTKSSKPVSLDHNGPGHYVIYSPVVLKEKKCDERWKEECDGEVLV